MIKHKLNPADLVSPNPADSNEMSSRSTFIDILRRVEEKMEAKHAKMLKAKIADIVDSVSSTMESMLNEAKS